MSCKEAMAAVINIVEHGGAMPDEQREHIKHCERCRELLDSANAFDAAIHDEQVPEPTVDEQRLDREVRGVRLRDVARRSGVAAVIAVMAVSVLAIIFGRVEDVDTAVIAGILGIIAVIAVMVAVTVHTLFGALRDRQGNRIYKRLKPGRQLSGVCLGLSEATGVNVAVFRLAFFALAFFKGIGLLLYVLLDLARPVHPDDRQYLLRFKLRRMWQRRFAR
jgi:phage shock protein PspC (stress-responsive transcriptional regulator)